MNTPIVPSTASPFDAIMRTDDYGNEYWSARDLMPMAGYSKWQDFRSAIDRAATSAINQGHNAETLFMSVHKKTLGRPMEDFNVTRFGCYLIFQNGDPRKPEIADAQGYFAIKTREAETQSHAPALDLTSLDSISQILNAGKAALNRALEAEKRADAAEDSLRAIENEFGYSIREFHKQYFSDVAERNFFNILYKKKLLIDQRNTRWDDKNQKWKDGRDHRAPAAAGKRFFYSEYDGEYGGHRRYQTKVRPGQPEVDLIAQLEAWGLPSNRNQNPNTTKKELL
jgi:phage antirepressor YoqD-like protein